MTISDFIWKKKIKKNIKKHNSKYMMQDMTAGQITMVIFYCKYLILKVRETQSWA